MNQNQNQSQLKCSKIQLIVFTILKIVKKYDIDTRDLKAFHAIIRFTQNFVYVAMQKYCEKTFTLIGRTKVIQMFETLIL